MILNAVSMGEGPPIVVLPGLFGQAGNFGVVQRRLARDFRVIVMDLRNHGASPHARGMGYAALAGDVRATLEHLGLSACGILGHSMGGKVAMVLALTAPDVVGRLLVADIAPVAHPPRFRAIAAAMAGIPLTPGLTRADADARLTDAVADAATRAFLLQNLRVGAAPAWKIGLAEITAGLPEIEGFPALDVPPFGGTALFLSGARSDFVRPEHRPVIRGLFPAARFVTLKDAGHWLHADNPDGFVAVASAFFG